MGEMVPCALVGTPSAPVCTPLCILMPLFLLLRPMGFLLMSSWSTKGRGSGGAHGILRVWLEDASERGVLVKQRDGPGRCGALQSCPGAVTVRGANHSPCILAFGISNA